MANEGFDQRILQVQRPDCGGFGKVLVARHDAQIERGQALR